MNISRRQFLIGLTASAATASSLTLENTDGVSLRSSAHPVRVNKLVLPKDISASALEVLEVEVSRTNTQLYDDGLLKGWIVRPDQRVGNPLPIRGFGYHPSG